MNIKSAGAVALSLCLVGGLAACDDGEDTLVPVAYGENGHCYYTDNPGEAYLLLSAGKCPAGWVAWPMPVYWHDRYWSYYSSPAWYTVYVPRAQQSYYKTTYITKYYSVNKAGIATAQKSAVYRGSSGKTYTGVPKSSSASFGGGNGRVASGSGNGTVKRDSSSSYKAPAPKSGTSFGGGSGRTGKRP